MSLTDSLLRGLFAEGIAPIAPPAWPERACDVDLPVIASAAMTSGTIGQRLRVAAFGCSALATSCGAAGFDGRVFRSDELSFQVRSVPAEWRRIEAGGALLAFRDDSAPASIEVGGRCGKDGDDVPLQSLTHHLFLEFTDRNVESQVKLTLDGREALRTELSAKLDGVEKRFTVVVLKKNGCVYDFVHVAPPAAPAEGRERFVAFVDGFSTISP